MAVGPPISPRQAHRLPSAAHLLLGSSRPPNDLLLHNPALHTASRRDQPRLHYVPSYCPPSAIQAPPRLPETIVEPVDDPYIRSCVEYYTYTDWAREQRAKPVCSATLWFLSLGSPSPSQNDLFDYIPSTRRPPLPEARTLATKGQLHTTDDNNRLLTP